jgi:hypothetical protein
MLWYQSLDDSQGWQTVTVPVLNSACPETFYFNVNQRAPIPVSVAFDDIEIDQCSSLLPTTTTISTSTSTMTTTTEIKTTSTSSCRTSIELTTMSPPTITSTSTTTQTPISATISTTTPNDAHRPVSLSKYNLISIYFLFRIFRTFF